MMFSNIAEAANFGAGGTAALFSDAQIESFSAKNSSCKYEDSTWKHNISNDNCVMVNGYRFKVVKTETPSSGDYAGKQILTLWSYNSTETGATQSFATDVKYKVSGDWSDGGTITPAEAYNNSDLKTTMDGLLTTDGSGNPNGGILYNSKLTYVKYSSTTDSNVTDAYVWAPSKTELESAAWGGGTTVLTNANRGVAANAWLRTPSTALGGSGAYFVGGYGGISFGSCDTIGNGGLLRPALQILNQTSWDFKSAAALASNKFTDNSGRGTEHTYVVNTTATAPNMNIGATTPLKLNGAEIYVPVTGVTAATSVAFSASDSTVTETTLKNMAKAEHIQYLTTAEEETGGTGYYHANVSNLTGKDYRVNVFGTTLDGTTYTTTEFGTGVIEGIRYENGVVNITIGSMNYGIALQLSGGAVAKLDGTANNNITVTDTGCLGGEGTLTGTVSGAGKLSVTGAVTAAADRFTQTGGLEVKNKLKFTSRGLDVTNVGGFTQTAGSGVEVPVEVIESDTNNPTKAMFTGVNDASKLDVSAGNLSLKGLVYENKYYVLAEGTAVDAGFVVSKLWKQGNISFKDVLLAEFEYDTNTSGNSAALKVTKVATFEEGNTSGLAAVQQGNMSVAKEFTGEVENHLGMMSRPSLLQKMQAKVRNVASTAENKYNIETVEQGNANEIMPVQVVEKDEYDKTVWASYIRTKETTEGMELGAGLKGDNTAQYNGYVVGVDFYSSKKAIAGMALSYTTGDIDSYSNGTSTRNKSKYYGVSFYDRVTNGNTALIYDIGYIRGDNDISQFYTGKETTSDVKTNTYTAGARWEAAIETGRSKIVPFAAFRYMRVNNGDYTNSHGVKFDTKNQNLYIPKVGIAWTGDFIMPKSVWTWRPSVEAGYVWNLGDRTADSNVLMGTRPAAIEYDTVDKSSYYAKAGMEFMHKNFTAGLFYRYLKGDKVRNNKWNVNVSWAF